MKSNAWLAALLLIVIAGGCGLFVKQAQQVHELNGQKAQAVEKAKKLTENQRDLETQIRELQRNTKKQDTEKQTQKEQTLQNNDETSHVRKRFSEVNKNFFNIMYNFNPDSYKERKTGVQAYLTEELMKQFFPDGSNLEDSNNMTSKIDHIEIYNRSIQEGAIDGIVVVTYESKQADNDYKKNMDVYQVSYQPSTEKLTKMQALGVGLPLSILDKDN